MKIFFSILLFFNIIYANILPLKDAFKISTHSNEQGIFIDIKLGKEIFLYSQKLKIILDDKDISSSLNLPLGIQKDKERVYYQNLNLNIPMFFLEKNNIHNAKLEIQYQGCSEQGLCYQPQIQRYTIEKKNNIYSLTPYNANKNTKILSSISEENDIANLIQTDNFFIVLLSFFGYGLLLSLTPCILPMIPILSSLIVSKYDDKISKKHSFFLSFIYVFFMSLAYAIAGIIASFLGASVQALLQTPIVLIIFAFIFILCALAMFDVFNFELPLKFQNFIHKKSHKGKGILSIALMGFLSALIVGPCVAAPLAGALIYIANTGNVVLGGSALFLMSFGMGAPLLFLGFGMGFLKPGNWMKKVKIIFGFIMLAMSIWILSRILPMNWILILFGIWGVFFTIFMGIFDSSDHFVHKFKQGCLILILSYSVTLFLGGLFGGKDFKNPFNINTPTNQSEQLHFEYISNLQELKKIIQNSSQKIMLDFTANWCENCKLLDEITFKDDKVIQALKEYKLIKIDLTNNNETQIELMKEFSVFGPPVLIFFEDSKESLKITGFISADNLLKKLEK